MNEIIDWIMWLLGLSLGFILSFVLYNWMTKDTSYGIFEEEDEDDEYY